MDDQLTLMRERGERLRQAAQAIGITRAAKAAGVPYTTLRDYMNGGEMKFSSIASLARVCGVSLDWLAYGVGEEPPPHQTPEEAPARGGHQAVIPWLDNREDGLRISKSWLARTFRQDGTALRLVSVIGDAMLPTLVENDLVILDTANQQIHGSGLFALAVDDSILIRRLERRLGGGLRVIADNDRYPPQDLTQDEASDLKIVGEVLWTGGVPKR
ncbi:XRE family transcriptional regulator [Acetobacter tropicalis]|nr:LexA family transcriptional regulator [Acetobacter oryzifermentans]ANA14479.1 repressor [Acetobacter oryzifermentans]KXV65909.1 repressor [Acetobacter orleanensis]PCD79803.1 phage repressor protein [Acetobacter orleanensis]